MSNSVQPHRWQPTRLPHPWDSPGKNTGVDFHFLLQCMKVKSESEVTQSCLTLLDPMDCSLPGSSVHRIFQARVLEWVAIAFSVETLRDSKGHGSLVCCSHMGSQRVRQTQQLNNNCDVIIIKKIQYWCKDRQMITWNRIESLR